MNARQIEVDIIGINSFMFKSLLWCQIYVTLVQSVKKLLVNTVIPSMLFSI
jgi:hypothetical protein